MRCITNYTDLSVFFKEAIGSTQEKPIIIWFFRDNGLSNKLLDYFVQDYINTNPDILKDNGGNNVIRSCRQKAIVFHRYVNQVDYGFLNVVLETKKKTRKPVFVLANEYEFHNRPSSMDNFFEEVCFDPNMTIALIACSKTKRPLNNGERMPAKDLYTGALFKKSWTYCARTGLKEVFILSDKYGLLDGCDQVETYDCDLNKLSPAQRARWADGILASLQKKGFNLSKDNFILLAGQQYCKLLLGPQKIEKGYSLFEENKLHGIAHILHFLR